MKNTLCLMVVCAAILAGIGPAAFATTWTVGTVSDLKSRLENNAAPGDTIRVLPGTYPTRLYAGNVHGAPGQLINVIAADPTNPPVFNSGGNAAFTIYNSSYVLVDGMITENAGATSGQGNNFEFPNCNHMIARNVVSRNNGSEGNSDGIKCSDTSNMLMWNCRMENWGDSGSAADIMNNHSSLFMRNTIINGDMYNGNGFQPKGNDAYENGFYKNQFLNFGARGQQFGGSSVSTGWEGRDMVAMGSTFEGGEAAVAYVSCTRSEFSYNTIVNPVGWVMRILKEGGDQQTADNTFKRNVVKYGNILVQNIGLNTLPATFNYEANYWYKWTNPPASIPSLPGGETDPAGGVDPQLDADYRPHYAPAKHYGAFAQEMEAAWAQSIDDNHWFDWAWDWAQVFEPEAMPGDVYHVGPGQTITLDAGASTPGVSSYASHPHTITDYLWDLDWDSDFDDATGQTAVLSYDDLTGSGPGQLALPAGWHTIELKILVDTAFGAIDEWGFAQIHIVDTLIDGDANYDEVVDLLDLTIVSNNWEQSPRAWIEGNFNDDDAVDLLDLTLLANNWNPGGSAVPEPITLALLALGGAALLKRRH